jgi:TRAP-type C4-dicarboxylate transport system substrate-binding protein
MPNSWMKNTVGMFAAVATAALMTAPAVAQQTIKITMVSGNAPGNTPIGAAIDAFSPAVDKALARTGKYRISWVHGFSGTIVKTRGELEGVETGLGDLGLVPGVFYVDKLPLYQISYMTPFTTKDVDVLAQTSKKVIDAFPEFTKEMEKYNQIPLRMSAVVENYAIWSKKELKNLNDLKGMKIGAGGPNVPWIRPTGAVPVLSTLDTMYSALQTGVYDATLMWQQVAGAFKLCELAPHHLDANLGGVAMYIFTANKDAWAKYPDEVKSAIREALDPWSEENNRRIKDGTAKGLELCTKQYNQKTVRLSDEDTKAWAKSLPPVARDWAKQRDAAGQPGSKILQAWMDNMRAQKQPMVREWDKE